MIIELHVLSRYMYFKPEYKACFWQCLANQKFTVDTYK